MLCEFISKTNNTSVTISEFVLLHLEISGLYLLFCSD